MVDSTIEFLYLEKEHSGLTLSRPVLKSII